MAGFHPYNDKVSIAGRDTQGNIVIEVDGSSSTTSPQGYGVEKNHTMTVSVTPETAREIIEDLEELLEEEDG